MTTGVMSGSTIAGSVSQMSSRRQNVNCLYADAATSGFGSDSLNIRGGTSGLSIWPASISAPAIITCLSCGLWHGAVWHFVLFGAINAFFLTIERIFKKNCSYSNRALGHLYMIVLVFPAFFLSVRANSVPQFFDIIQTMYLPAASSVDFSRLFDAKSLAALAAGLVFGFPVYGIVTAKFGKSKVFKCLEAALLVILFAASLSSNTMVFSDPFIYFRF